jgi:hypothetical protein
MFMNGSSLVARSLSFPSPYPLPQGKGVSLFLYFTPFPDGEAVEREGGGGGVVSGESETPIVDLARSFEVERSDHIK